MKKTTKLPNVEPVKIKSVGSVKPGKWLFFLYIIGAILLIFLVGVLPGIIHGFERVSFYNTSETTAVYIDDEYKGGTPCSIKVESGTHNIKYKIGDITVDEFNMEISHPIFFTWLFPKKSSVSRDAVISTEAYKSLTENFFKNVSAYSAIRDYDNVYKYPPLFCNYASSIVNVNFSKEILIYAAQFITTKEMLEDAKKAFEYLEIDYDFSEIEKNVSTGNFRTSSLPIYGTIQSKENLVTNNFTVGGFNYGTFKLAGVPVNETMYAFFVEENPKWAPENKEQLLQEGLVDENYLEGITLTTQKPTFKAITNVSFYAAKAFCEWLSETTGKNVHLPSEIEWTAAAASADPTFTKTTTAMVSSKGPAGMFGGVWEFTSTFYVPNQSQLSSDIQNFLTANNFVSEPIVKGGCYTSNVNTISAYTIGLVSPFLCADFYGFRIAWD